MSDKNVGWKLLVTAGVVLFLIWEMYPPSETLKGGIDLVGGTSLLYEIDDSGLPPEGRKDLAERVMQVLRRRVDPDGVRNLVWRPIGDNRLEIQMPHPPKEGTARREAYRQTQQELKATNLHPREVEQALQLRGQQRVEALEELVRSVPSRPDLLEQAAAAYDGMLQVQTGDDEQTKLDAEEHYESALDELLATNVDLARLSAIAGLNADSPMRQQQLAEFKLANAGRSEPIDAVIAAYDLWAEVRGGLDDAADLQRLLRGAGVLEFRILPQVDPNNPPKYDRYREQLAEKGSRISAGDEYGWFEVEKPLSFWHLDKLEDFEEKTKLLDWCIAGKFGDTYYVLAHLSPKRGLLSTGRTRWSLKSASPRPDPEKGGYLVDFVLDERGGGQFEVLTRENQQKPLCILLDGVAISAPRIQSTIRTRGQISGDFTEAEVNYLAQTLNAGALPARLKQTPISVKNIGPSLGKANREMGTRAAMWAVIAVVVFIGGYYLISGLIADVAVVMNILLVLGMMAAMNATFTLPGIAGLALTIGMAVDANVLINERIREELARGVSFRLAIKTGYEKAFSAIVDSNVTTIISCVILGYFGSEEVKGFALTLGLGLVCNIFTAVFLTRWILTALVSVGLVRSLPMLRLFRVPNIDWMSKRRFFHGLSLVLVIGGLLIFFGRGKDLYDIEFRGGVSAQIELKQGVTMTDAEVRRKVTGDAGDWLQSASEALASARVVPQPGQSDQFNISGPPLTATQIGSFVLAVMEPTELIKGKGGVQETGTNSIRVTMMPKQVAEDESQEGEQDGSETVVERLTVQDVRRLVNEEAAKYARQAARKLSGASVQMVAELGVETAGDTFEIITTETNKKIVRDAILAVMRDQLNIEGQVNFSLRTDPVLAAEGLFPVEQRRLAAVINDQSAAGDVRDYLGGVAIVLDGVSPPQTEQQIRRRLRDMRLQPDFEQYEWRDFDVIGLTATGAARGQEKLYSSMAIVVADTNYPYDEDELAWRQNLADPELTLVTSALGRERSLQKVMQFGKQVASQARNEALLAMILALLAIVLYIWVRFGTLRHGLAAIVALVHDVSIVLGAVAVGYAVSLTPVGRLLGIEDFKIDLAMIAAFLTLIGYSLNDTIVVFDRIRENRGKLASISAPLINSSINQILGRTVLTSVTTLFVVLILYVQGGRGIHAISYALLVGVIVGTYSSIAVASPLLLSRVRRQSGGR